MISPEKPEGITNEMWKSLNKKQKSTMNAMYPALSPSIKNNITENLVNIVDDIGNKIILDIVKENKLEKLLCSVLSQDIVNGWDIDTNSIVIFKKTINKPLYFNSDKQNVVGSMIRLINDLIVAERKGTNGIIFWKTKRGQINDLILQLKEFKKRTKKG